MLTAVPATTSGRFHRVPGDLGGAGRGPVLAGSPVMVQTLLRRTRDFLLLQTGQLLSTFGSGLSGIAYPLLALV